MFVSERAQDQKKKEQTLSKLASNMIGLFPKMTRTVLSRLLISQSDCEITGICCWFFFFNFSLFRNTASKSTL